MRDAVVCEPCSSRYSSCSPMYVVCYVTAKLWLRRLHPTDRALCRIGDLVELDGAGSCHPKIAGCTGADV